MSQADAILADLFAGHAVTPQDALQRHGIMRLAAIIHILRADGFRIHAEIVTAPNRHGYDVAFARYTLSERRRARSLIAQRARARIATPAPKRAPRRKAAPAKRAGRRA